VTKSIAPPSRYWAIQKNGTTVQRHETVAEDLESISYVIPDSCDTTPMSESELSQATPETGLLDEREKRILGM
jgi:hypothetical protein